MGASPCGFDSHLRHHLYSCSDRAPGTERGRPTDRPLTPNWSQPIPVERQAVATETFWASSGAFIRKGTILSDDAEPVRAHPGFFVRPPRPLEAA